MFTVSIGHYGEYTLAGVYGAENVARLLARKLRGENVGDSVKLSVWQGQQESVIARWSQDYNSRLGRTVWHLSEGKHDA